ncbi:MAG: SsrA-binding protein SmpB [Nitrospiraceae bacterium]|nr:SsrA-binding protein SmpB [Nitrospiraceae bacterium]
MKKKGSTTNKSGTGRKLIAQNKRARHEYEILEELECGIELRGAEVKSLRLGRAQIQDAYARIISGEIWLYQMNIARYEFARGFGETDPLRPRKLLAHRDEIDELTGKLQQKSLTLVPLALYFKEGHAKVLLGLARGKKLYDKRRVLAERTLARESAREMADARRSRR